MSKPWRDPQSHLEDAYDVLPGSSWGTVIIDGETETVDKLTYQKDGCSCILIKDGPFYVEFWPVEYGWVGEGFPEELRGKWSLHSVRRTYG